MQTRLKSFASLTALALTSLTLATTAALTPTTAMTENWQPLDAPAITQALTARILAYKDGATQQFNADGSTVYTTDHESTGAWRVDGPQFCSEWPPSDKWSCYDMAVREGGLDLRFTAGDGSESVGRYVDLK